MNLPLFAPEPGAQELAPGAVVLRCFALPQERALIAAVERVVELAPFRRFTTPGGRTMSVAMTNCGGLGWVSDRGGYRYDPCDPQSGRRWPAMPEPFVELARRAAEGAGYPPLEPDACLVNRYDPGTRLSLHQDKDELDLTAPIVSVSLGLPATFLFGGSRRSDPTQRVRLEHGDVVVWGGPSRLVYHGVLALAEGDHPLLGRQRVNLTFRRVVPAGDRTTT